LQTIAQAYGLNIQDLVKQNNIVNPNAIFAGQVLNIRPIAAAPTALPALLPPASSPSLESTQLIHVVQPGETLFRIATRYHLTVNELARANTIDDPTLIYAGQQILIPSRQESQASLDLPSPVSSVDGTAAPFIEGKTGRIRLVTTVPVNMSVSFFGKPVGSVAEENNTRHTILVGIPIFTEPGLYPLAFTMTDATGQQTNFSVNVQIASGNYGREFITLKSDRAELLDPNLETSEQTLLQGIMGAFTPQRYFEGPMSLPAAANMTSPFGRKRSYNGGPFDHFHSGTDFAGASGTPVLAAASGVVAFAGALNVRGNATIIDHGWGVFTGYWHQTDQYVKVGDSVTTGQVIGTIGSSGRVTGPHLHWELWVNGVPVDPMQWVRQSFS
jgi:murein DD-endopeptidase MepM/ murein hydrolase activator NlpD